jgi:hypothetical protein
MAAKKSDGGGLIDLAAIALSPLLILLMVGSLVAFLIEVIYRGAYTGRLLWTFFFYTAGTVLVARITIEQGRARAGVYALGLGAACLVAMTAFVEYPAGALQALGPVVNVGLMALVWFCADRLTWDCTHFDDARKASGRGVLAAVGLDEAPSRPDDEPNDDEVELTAKQRKLGWFERFEAYRAERKKRPHTPGTRILVFGLAALPVFALGQSLVPADDAARRSWTFLYAAAYVASALALLVTTNLFGLRRYLQERGATLSPTLIGAWLGTGALLIFGFVAAAAILPRPHSETPLVNLGKNRTSDRSASKNAQVRDSSSGKGDGAAGQQTKSGDGQNSAKGGKQSGGKSGEKGSGGGKGDSQGGKQHGGDKSGEKGQQNDTSDGSQSKKQDQKGGNKGTETDADQGNQQGNEPGDKGNQADEAEGDSADDSGSTSGSSAAMQKLSQISDAIGSFVKWVVWVVVAAAVLIGGFIFVLKYLAPFTNWARNLLDWLRNLFHREKEAGPSGAIADEPDDAPVKRPPPFDDFANPFGRGKVKRKPGEVVEYTFAALDAWAWDRGSGRKPGETATEFAARLGHEHADLDEPAFAVAQLYARTQYSRRPVASGELVAAERLWDALESQPHPSRGR